MASRVIPVVLVLLTALADAYGLHRVGFYLLVAAVPAAAVAALWSVGEMIEPRTSPTSAAAVRLGGLLSALVLVAVLGAAGARGQATDTSTVPPASASALVTCLALFALQGAVALASSLPRGRYSASSWRANKIPSENVG